MRTALAQFAPHHANKIANLALMSEYLHQAKEQKADVVIFPELALTGYSIGEQLDTIAETIDGPSIQHLQAQCKKTGIAAVVSFPEQNGNRYHISTVWIEENGTLAGVYRKTHLFSTESRFFTPGDQWPVFETSLGRIGMMICYDLEFPEVARLLRLNGAELIVVNTANMTPYESYQQVFMLSRAMENEIPLVICNRLGVEEDLSFFGHSMAVNHEGKVLLHLGGEEGVQTVDVPLGNTRDPKLNYVVNLHPTIRFSLLNSMNQRTNES